MQLNKTKIQSLISQGELKATFLEFKKAELSKDKKSALTILESEYNILMQEMVKGLISNDEKQLRQNRITNKLLLLLEEDSESGENIKNRKTLLASALSFGVFLAIAGYFFFTNQSNPSCPNFNADAINKILLLPFENVSDGATAKPHLLLRDRIEELAIKNNLSTNIELGVETTELSINKAPEVAKLCGANVIIWGKYSNTADSLRLILQYHFLDYPDWSKYSELAVLKDFTSIQHGRMFKKLDDSIMSLCSVIAIRQGKKKLAEKWLSKIEEKEEVDIKIGSLVEK